MKNIQLDIKNVVSKNLNMRRDEVLAEHFNNIQYSSTDELIRKHVEKTIELLNEGYELHELDGYIKKTDDMVKSLVEDVDYGGMFKESMYSMAKEFAIKVILEFIGVGKSTSTYLAQGLADLNYKDVLYPWKNKEYCVKHLPNLLDSIFEVLVRKFGHDMLSKVSGSGKIDKAKELQYDIAKKQYEDNLKKYRSGEIDVKPRKPYEPDYSKNSYNDWRDVLNLGIGNISGELIRKTQTSEAIANFICPKIHK